MRFPLKTDFGAPDPPPLRANATIADLLAQRAYEPTSYVRPSDEEIRKYSEIAYPAWINNCRQVLSKLNEMLQSDFDHAAVTFVISNNSNSTGQNVLVRFVSYDGILIRPPRYVPPDSDDSTANKTAKLPEPPAAPEGFYPIQRVESFVRQTLGQDSISEAFKLPIAPPYM